MQQASVVDRIPEGALQPGDLAIDAGANVGAVTQQMLDFGAEVHAFEPNTVAFAALAKRFEADPRVHCHRAAVGAHDGAGLLFMHELAATDPLKYSTGSSMCADKINVCTSSSVRVQVIDLARFVLSLERPVSLLKLDVEGLEAVVLKRMCETGALAHVRLTLVESHEQKTPSVRAPLEQVRALLRMRPRSADNWGEVRFDWI